MVHLLVPSAVTVVILLVSLALYYPRFHNRDLTTSYPAANITELGVAIAMGSTSPVKEESYVQTHR